MEYGEKKIEMIFLNEEIWGHSPRYLLKRCVVSFRIHKESISFVFDINIDSNNSYTIISPWFLYSSDSFERNKKKEKHYITLIY
jgi:hypothetical protein